MVDVGTIGKITELAGNGEALIIRATGEQVVAQLGDAVFPGDTIVTSDGTSVLVEVDNGGIDGFVTIEQSRSARFDDVLFGAINNLIVTSSKEDPVSIGTRPLVEIILQANEVLPTGIRTANEDSQTETVVDNIINLEELLEPAAAGPDAGQNDPTAIAPILVIERNNSEGSLGSDPSDDSSPLGGSDDSGGEPDGPAQPNILPEPEIINPDPEPSVPPSTNSEPTLSLTASNPTYTEGSATVGLFSGASVSTVETGQTITGYTLTVRNVTDGAAEQLIIDGTTINLVAGTGTTSGSSFSYVVTVSGTTVSLVFSGGTASTADVEADLNGVTYHNTSENPTGTERVVTVTQIVDSGGTANGGDNTNDVNISSTVTVNSVNDEPTLSLTASNPAFSQGNAPVGLFSGASVSTVESGQTITGYTLTVTNVADGSDEKLTIDGTTIDLVAGTGTTSGSSFTYTVTVSGSTVTVVLSGGTASVADVEADLNAATYQNTSVPTTDANRVITVTEIVDSGGTANGGDDTSNPNLASTVTVDSVNDEPTLTLTASNPTYTEGSAAVGVFSGASVSTVESGQTITGYTLTVTNVTDGASEQLTIDGTTINLVAGTGTTSDSSFTYTVTVSGSTVTVVLSGGTASTADVEADLNAATYQNTSDNPTDANRVVTVTQIVDSGGTANGGDDTNDLSLASTVNVNPVNDEPTLSLTASNPDYNEGSAAVGLFSGASVSTVETGQTITGYTLTVTNVQDGAAERLTIDGTTINLVAGTGTTSGSSFTYTVTVSGTTVTVVLSGGTASTADVEADLNAATYQNTAANPTDGNRVVTVTQIVDSGGTTNGGDDTNDLNLASTVNVNPVNDEPTLTLTASNPDYNEGSAAVGLFSGASVSTVEAGQTITGYTLTVTNVTDGASEQLTIDGTTINLVAGTGTTSGSSFTYTVTVSGTTVTVVLSGGTASAADVEADLNAATYQNTSDDPTDANRVVTVTQIVDSGGTANGGDDTNDLSLASTVNVNPVNDEPTLTLTASNPTYTDGSAAVGLFSGASVSTVESGQTITGYTLTVTNVTDGASEQLTIDGTTINLVAGTGTTSGSSFTYTVTVSGSTVTVVLSGGTASAADVEADLNAATYQNTSTDPTDANRVVTVTQIVDSGGTANGGDGTNDLSLASTVNVNPVNDEPTLTVTGSDPVFNQGDAAVGLFSGASVSTIEAGQTITGYTLTVSNVTDGTDEKLTIDGTTIDLVAGTGTTSGSSFSYTVTVSGSTVTVVLSGGTASTADVEADLNAATYQNTSDDPTDANRVVTVTQMVDSGGTANGGDDTNDLSLASTVNVNPVNDQPTLVITPSDPTYSEGSAAVGLFSGASVSTVESGQTITGYTLTVTNVTDGTDEKLTIDGTTIDLVAGTGTTSGSSFTYTVTVSGTTVTVVLSGGTASTADVEADLNAATYQNTSEDPTDANRVVTVTQIVDSGGTANGGDDTNDLSLASTVNVNPVNDEPTLTLTGSDPTYNQGNPAVGVFSGVSVSTVEAGQTITGYTLTVTNVQDGAAERLTIDGTTINLVAGTGTTSGSSFTYTVTVSGSTVTVVLSGGTASTADVEADLNAATYQNTEANPTDGNRVVTVTQIVDSGGTANGGDDTNDLSLASTVNVNSINDEPTLSLTPSNPDYNEGSAAAGLFSGASVSTVESGQTITGYTLTVTNVTDGTDEKLTIDGTTIDLVAGTGTTSGSSFTYTVTVSGSTVTVVLSGGTASTADVEADLNAATYQNTSDDPTDANRVVTVTQIVDSGGTANGGDDTNDLSIASTVNVNPVNDEPTLSLTGSNPDYNEGSAAVGLFSGASVSTVESGQTITGYTLTVTNVTDGTDEKLTIDGTTIDLVAGTGTTSGSSFTYTVTVSGSTVTVVLSGGTASTADVEADLNAATYQNTSDDPTDANRVVTVTQIVDSGGTANGGDDTNDLSLASTVNVNPVNDEPTLTLTASNPDYNEGSAAVGLFSGASVSTVESGQTITGYTLTVTNVTDGTDEKLTIDGTTIDLVAGTGTTSGSSFTYTVTVSGSTVTVVLSGGTASTADVEADLNAATYQNTSDDPTDANRVVTVTQIVDSGGTANGGDDTNDLSLASTVNVNPVNDEPTLTLTASNPDYNEGTAAVGLFSGASVSTVESGQTITGYTLTVTNVTDGAAEQLTIDGTTINLVAGTGTTSGSSFTYTVTVSGTTVTVVLSGGTASTADVEADLNAATYQNTSEDPTDANRVVTVTQIVDSGGTANGGDDTNDLSLASTVNVNPVNDPPTLVITPSDPTYSEGSAAVGLFSGASVSTGESGQTITGYTLTVSNVTDGSAEQLTIDGTTINLVAGTGTTSGSSFTYTVTVSGTTVTIVLSGGTASTADVEADLNAATYQNTSDDPTDANRVVTVTQLVDSGGTSNGGNDTNNLSLASTVNVNPVNDEPTLTLTASNPDYNEGSAAVGLFSGASVSTVESGQTITGYTLTVSNVTDGAAEQLTIDGTTINLVAGTGTTSGSSFSYTVTVSGTTVTIVLSGGTASTADVEADLNAATYQNTSDDPTDANRVVTVTQIVDSGGTANGGDDTNDLSLASTVNVNPVNDEPTLTLTASNSDYNEGSAAVGLFSGASVSTVESGQTITGYTLTVSNVTDGAAEQLTIDGTTINLVPGTGTTSGSSFSYTVTVSGTTVTIVLSGGTASTADVEADLNAATYQNTSDDPTDANRVVTVTQIVDSGGTANGGDDTNDLSLASTVNVNPVNDEPTLSLTSSNPTYTEGSAAVGLFSGASVSTVESGQTITGYTLTVTNVTDGTAEQLTIDGTTINLVAGTGTTSGSSFTYTVTVSGSTVTVVLSGGTASTADVEADLNAATYQNTSENPTDANRVVTVTQIVDSGGTANGGDDTNDLSLASTVNVNPEDDAPVLVVGNATFAEATDQGNSITLDSGASLTDVDSDTILSITVRITGNYQNGEDVLAFVGDANFSAGVFDAGTGTLTLNAVGGTDKTIAQAQAAIRAVTYSNSGGDNPTANVRTLTWTAFDTTNTAQGSDTSTLTVTAENDLPTITGAGGTLAATDYKSARVIDSTLTVSDPDNATLASARIWISNNFVSTEDVLSFTENHGITGSYNSATGELTLIGSATLAQYEEVLESVTYDNTNNTTASTSDRTISWTVNDGTSDSVAVTSTVTVTNDPRPVFEGTAVGDGSSSGTGPLVGTAADEIFLSRGINNTFDSENVNGNGGNDLYVVDSATYANNSLVRIRDFNFSTGAAADSERDAIDLSDVLVGATSANINNDIDIRFNSFGGQDILEIYFDGDAPGDGRNTLAADLNIDTQGANGGIEVAVTGILDLSGLGSAAYLSAGDELTVLQQMITDGSLLIDC